MQDIEALEAMWDLTKEWEGSWNEWKQEDFISLQTEGMTHQAQNMLNRLVKQSKGIKVQETELHTSIVSFILPTLQEEWTIVASLRARLDVFLRTTPLLDDLKNPAMRERHWDQLRDEMQQSFEQASKDFTMEKIIDLGMEQYHESIANISSAASKELVIEKVQYCIEVPHCMSHIANFPRLLEMYLSCGRE